ncbi:putative toxin-antitoxin system toxin component, PIN family [Candidatus Moduliflexota bacterium]
MEAVTVFLDSNILFSLCWKNPEESVIGIILELQKMGEVKLVISPLTLEETTANLKAKKPEALSRLQEVVDSCTVVADVLSPLEVDLPENDLILLSTAIASKVDFFLTGNKADFGPIFGRTFGSTRILTPRAFLSKER